MLVEETQRKTNGCEAVLWFLLLHNLHTGPVSLCVIQCFRNLKSGQPVKLGDLSPSWECQRCSSPVQEGVGAVGGHGPDVLSHSGGGDWVRGAPVLLHTGGELVPQGQLLKKSTEIHNPFGMFSKSAFQNSVAFNYQLDQHYNVQLPVFSSHEILHLKELMDYIQDRPEATGQTPP